jgi:fido (protein-threonine AMPylation protein)
MPTKYDVFAEIVERAPCKANDLSFETPVYGRIKSLLEMGWIKEVNQKYIPIKNEKTTAAFNIIKYSIQDGLDYNVFFSKNAGQIVNDIFVSAPNLRPVKGNKDIIDFLNYLEDHQFIILIKKRPKKGIILKHSLFENLFVLNNIKKNITTTKYIDVYKQVLELTQELNPFDDSVFSFLSGSARLEGSTVTPGETKELILNDIYPDKPQKDIQMIKNLNEAMHYMFEHLEEKINTQHIKDINRLVIFSLHRHAGKYKIADNKIQGNPDFKTAPPKEVPAAMEKYVAYLNSIKARDECLKNIGYIHNELQSIHPFADGNSRTTRMIINWMLMKFNSPILVLKMGSFEEYMSLTKLSKKRNDQKLSLLMYHLILHETIN